MKKEVREVGRELADRWLQHAADFQREFRQAVQQRRLHPKHDFIRALYQHARGDSRYLIEYLRSPRPLTSTSREQFAQVLEGDLNPKKKRGRLRASATREAAFQAMAFYRAWIKENRTRAIKNHGQSDAMKDEAVRFVIEELDPRSPPVDPDKVRQLLDRPKSRRNG